MITHCRDARAIAVVLLIGLVAGVLLLHRGGADGSPGRSPQSGPEAVSPEQTRPVPPAGASQSWWSAVQEEIRAGEYHILYHEETQAYSSPNRAHDLRFTYYGDGFAAAPGRRGAGHDWRVRLRLVRHGRGTGAAFVPGTVEAWGRTARAEGDGVELRFENDARGMRQDFVVAERPAGEGPLRLLVRTETEGVEPAVDADAVSFVRSAPGGAEVLRYADLHVYDAEGRTLAAWFEGAEAGFAVVVEDADAVYPVLVDPLSQSPAWIVESNQGDARLGFSVSSAGDLNGDGFDDVAVGAPQFSNGQAREGRVFIYFGSASGLPTTAGAMLESNTSDAALGWAVAPAGDVNGDGYDDLLISGRYYTFSDFGEDKGRVFVYFGASHGIQGSSPWSVQTTELNDRFGWSVASAGDVNGDGFDDILIGAPWRSDGQTNTGRAYLYHGSATGLPSAPNWTGQINTPQPFFGSSVAPAGDVNGDGYGDVIIGAYWYSNVESHEGAAFVYHGSPTGLPQAPNWSVESNRAGSFLGSSVSSAGDVNGDGFSDVVVGEERFTNGQTEEGAAHVYYGSASGLATTAAWSVEGNQANAELGGRVASAGDTNGDGFDDVVLGNALHDNGHPDEGRAFLYTGSATGLSPSHDWDYEINQAGANFGYGAAAAGDVNGDGFDDVIFGAPYYTNGQSMEGRAYVFYGTAHSLKLPLPHYYVRACAFVDCRWPFLQLRYRVDLPELPRYDWPIRGDQVAVSFYLVPDADLTFGAAEAALLWDPEHFDFVGIDPAGGLFDGEASFEYRADAAGSLRMSAARLDGRNVTSGAGSYLARVMLRPKRAGHLPIGFPELALYRLTDGGARQALDGVAGLSSEARFLPGDVTAPEDPTTGDGVVDHEDLAHWREGYWSGVKGYEPGHTYYLYKFDLGPTRDGTVYGLPASDERIDFEDLVLFAVSSGLSASGGYEKGTLPEGLEQSASVEVGEVEGRGEVVVPVRISPVEDLRAFSLTLDVAGYRFVRVEAGELLPPAEKGLSFVSALQTSAGLQVDGAVLTPAGLSGEGTLVRLVLEDEGGRAPQLLASDLRDSAGRPLAVERSMRLQESTYEVHEVYPNPFNPATEIQFVLPEAGAVRLVVYDVLGREVARLLDGRLEAGLHRARFEAGHLPSGTYLYRLETAGGVFTRKMLLLK